MSLLIIQTGGTIDKDYPKVTQGYAFEISRPAAERILEKINLPFGFEVLPLLQKDSLEITEEDRQKIVDACRSAQQDKIIVTHGTDTMLETAQRLQEVCNKVIVLTGAMRPERFINSDADFNFGMALGAVGLLSNGVYIAMHGRVLPAENCQRNLATGQFIEKALPGTQSTNP